MKRIILIVFSGYILVGVVFSLSGGYYKEKALAKTAVHMDFGKVTSIVDAYKTSEGLTNICFNGEFHGLNLEEPFLVSIPKSVHDVELIGKEGFGKWYTEYRVKTSDLLRCSDNDKSEDLPVNKSEVKYVDIYSGSNSIPVSLDNLTVGYVHELTALDSGIDIESKEIAFIFNKNENKQYVFVRIEGQSLKGSSGWYALLPFAVMFDAITYPIQIYSYVTSHG